MRILYCLAVFAVSFTAVSCGDHPDGISKVSRAQDVLGNYQFSYSVSNTEGEQFRKEETDPIGRVIGSYSLTHNDGTHRIVDYVADKDGFRAHIRSNEPGVASSEAAHATIVRTDQDLPLVAAATSNVGSGSYGDRLRTSVSKVAYVSAEEDSKKSDNTDNAAKETRQQNFDDYRPQSPVAYYPSEATGQNSSPLRTSDFEEARRLRSQAPTADSKPPDVYFPPIDPHTAVRRPGYYLPRERGSEDTYFRTTSRRPFTPPYGGFDDDPLPVDRRPGISMTTIHGGVGSDRLLPSPVPTPGYGAGRYPASDTSAHRDFGLPRYPLNPNYASIPRVPGSVLPRVPGSVLPLAPRTIPPGVLFGHPSYDGRAGPPNFVLRAVPIPNGIQAVKVDPTTGQVYERLTYPLFLRPDGIPAYDKNILLHNDDVSDDDAIRNDNPGYFDIPLSRRPNYRGARNQPFDEDFQDRNRQYNRSYVIDERSLSKPSARDIAWVNRQLALVEGFNRNLLPNRLFRNSLPYQNAEDSETDDFDATRIDARTVNDDSGLSNHFHSAALYDRPEDDSFSRNPRHTENLTPSDSKEVQVKESKSTSNGNDGNLFEKEAE